MNISRHLMRELKSGFSAKRNLNFSATLSNKSHEQFIIKSKLADVVLPNTSFLERLWRDSASFKNLVAVECAETRKSYTYEQLWDLMARWANALRRIAGGDTSKNSEVIAVMLPNSPDFPVVALGAIQAGYILTTVNPIYKELEITHQLKLTQPTVIVTTTECHDTVVKALKLIKSNAKIIIVDEPSESIPTGAIRYSELIDHSSVDASQLNKIDRKLEELAFLPFSSGTTGLPKGVELTFKNVVSAMDMMHDEKVSLPKLSTATFQDVVPCVLPFFHIYGLIITMIGHLAKGCKLVTLPKFSTNLYLDVLKKDKATLLYVVPPIAILLAKHPDVGEEHLRHVRHLLCGAAPLSASDVEPLVEKSKGSIHFQQGYGATETTSVVTSTLLGEACDYSCAGVPVGSTELLFVDPLTGKPTAPGQQGELYVRGPNIMRGYYKNEQATKDSITEDGFFKTGDLGYFKENTGLYITDRIKELIKVKGMQVAPAELESILRSHPAVQDAAVLGVPHEMSGEVPKAFIIAKGDKKVSAEELQSFVADKVASFKKIEAIQFVNDIPKTASGKILRRELKKMYA